MNDLSYTPVATAFISCSLRPEDNSFVSMIEGMLKYYRIQLVGTVGRHDASATNPIVQMQQNIPNADMMVIAATPRYLQQDVGTGQTSRALSEMIHVESAMAVAFGKPVIVFAKPGTDIGGFLPNVTQTIYLSTNIRDIEKKEELIRKMFENTLKWLDEERVRKGVKTAGQYAVGGLAAFGAFKLAQWLFTDSSNDEK